MVNNGTTMTVHERALAIVRAALDDVNGMAAKGKEIPGTPETPLMGSNSQLDSLALVNFLVAVETRAEELEGLDLMLAADLGSKDALASLATIGSLIAALEDQIAGS